MKKILAVILLLSACSPIVNSTNTVLHDESGEEQGKVNISFSTYNGKNGKMTLATSDGEIYQGNVIGMRSESEDDMFELTGSRYYSKAKAILISNRGHSMKCNFDLAEPRLGITSGAIGECESSNGLKVPVTMSGNTKKFAD